MTAHTPSIRYGKQGVDGINIVYREAAATTSPAVLLLHGFPSSPHMVRTSWSFCASWSRSKLQSVGNE